MVLGDRRSEVGLDFIVDAQTMFCYELRRIVDETSLFYTCDHRFGVGLR